MISCKGINIRWIRCRSTVNRPWFGIANSDFQGGPASQVQVQGKYSVSTEGKNKTYQNIYTRNVYKKNYEELK